MMPSNYVIVPLTPTTAMLDAALAGHKYSSTIPSIQAAYSAMMEVVQFTMNVEEELIMEGAAGIFAEYSDALSIEEAEDIVRTVLSLAYQRRAA